MIENTINQEQRDRQRAKRMGVAPSSSLRRHFLALARQCVNWNKGHSKPGRTCSIGITSMARGAGNSTVAYNLSVALTSIARSRVLLVESDFGRHFITRRMGNARQKGLAELLTETADMQNVAFESPISNLDVVGCGQITEQVALELPFDALPEVIDREFSDYGYSVFDMPIASHLTAFYSLAPSLDGVVLNVDASQIDQKSIARFRHSLNSIGVPIIGMVINKQ